jgi:hypothetical protein
MALQVGLSKQKEIILFWLILKDCLSTRALLKRRNMDLPDYNCVLYSLNVEEDIFISFLMALFPSSYWFSLNLMVSNNSDPLDIMESFKDQLSSPFFMEIIITMCWTIWTMRNDVIFNIPHSVQ